MTAPHALPPPVLAGLPTKSRVLGAIRWLFRRDGLPSSHSEIASLAGIATKRVPRYVRQLAQDGVLTHRHGERRSITLVDRASMLSDDEWALGAPGRGATIVWSRLPALADAFPLADQGVAEWGLKLLAALDHNGDAAMRPRSAATGSEHGEAQVEDPQGERRDVGGAS